jgi:hypothetical protein
VLAQTQPHACPDQLNNDFKAECYRALAEAGIASVLHHVRACGKSFRGLRNLDGSLQEADSTNSSR